MSRELREDVSRFVRRVVVHHDDVVGEGRCLAERTLHRVGNGLLTVEDGKIASAKLYGDFFGISDVSDIETALCGTLHREENIKNTLDKFKLSDYFGNITAEELAQVLV